MADDWPKPCPYCTSLPPYGTYRLFGPKHPCFTIYDPEEPTA